MLTSKSTNSWPIYKTDKCWWNFVTRVSSLSKLTFKFQNSQFLINLKKKSQAGIRDRKKNGFDLKSKHSTCILTIFRWKKYAKNNLNGKILTGFQMSKPGRHLVHRKSVSNSKKKKKIFLLGTICGNAKVIMKWSTIGKFFKTRSTRRTALHH